MKKIITFSLWGKSPIYNYGLLENVIIAKDKYPDWMIKIYYSKKEDCIEKIIDKIAQFDNVILIKMNPPKRTLLHMYWRFIPAFEDDYDVLLVRDADSRIGTERELLFLDQWLKTDKQFHIIRDYYTHGRSKILGGMWSCRDNILHPLKNDFNKFFINNIKLADNIDEINENELFMINKNELQKFKNNSYSGYDMFFLERIIYPFIINDSVIHISKGIIDKEGYRFKNELKDNCKIIISELFKNERDHKEPDFVGAIVSYAPLASKLLNDKCIRLKKRRIHD